MNASSFERSLASGGSSPNRLSGPMGFDVRPRYVNRSTALRPTSGGSLARYSYLNRGLQISAVPSEPAPSLAQEAEVCVEHHNVVRSFAIGGILMLAGFAAVMVQPLLAVSWATDLGLVSTAAGALIASGASERYRRGR